MRRALLAVLILAAASPARGQEATRDAFAEITEQVVEEKGFAPLLAICPADLFPQTLVELPRRVPTAETCAADPDLCARLCLAQSDGEACLSLATVIEARQIRQQQRAAGILHARACALGIPAGCSGRALGLRGTRVEGGALAVGDGPAKDECLFRTFLEACQAGDAWGCAMAGQGYALGEGVAKNEEPALARYRRVCQLVGLTHPACRLALDGSAAILGE